MTHKLTSAKKLVRRNEKVKDLRSALLASRWKWREVQKRAIELWNLIDHTCGFCILAMDKRNKSGSKCSCCPEDVRLFCNELQGKTSEIGDSMDYLIDSALDFLNELKYDGAEN